MLPVWYPYVPVWCFGQDLLPSAACKRTQHCWMLHVASVCTPCCVLLNGVACCCAKFETGQTFSPVQTDATLLAYNSQHCWELLRPFARSLVALCTYQCKAGEGGGGGGRAWGGDLIVSVVPRVGHLTDLVLPGREYLNLSSPDVEIFDCRLGRKRLRPNICFPLPRFTHAPYGLKRSGSH